MPITSSVAANPNMPSLNDSIRPYPAIGAVAACLRQLARHDLLHLSPGRSQLPGAGDLRQAITKSSHGGAALPHHYSHPWLKSFAGTC